MKNRNAINHRLVDLGNDMDIDSGNRDSVQNVRVRSKGWNNEESTAWYDTECVRQDTNSDKKDVYKYWRNTENTEVMAMHKNRRSQEEESKATSFQSEDFSFCRNFSTTRLRLHERKKIKIDDMLARPFEVYNNAVNILIPINANQFN